MSKARRNDPCPCGSGKKYKKCHMDEDQRNEASQPVIAQESSFLQLAKSYNSISILKFLGILQLVPQNHGFNEELEGMVRITQLYRVEKDTRPFASWQLLLQAIGEYCQDAIPTGPVNAFTENAVFSEGNYIVYPGLYVNGTEILNQLLEAIFIIKNELPSAYVKLVNDAVGLLLYLSDGVAKIMEQKRYLFAEAGEAIAFPEYKEFISSVVAVEYTRDHLKKVAELFHYDLAVLDEFIVKFGDAALTNDDPEENVVLAKPLAETTGEVIVCMPTTIVGALVDFIYAKAKAMGCYALLVSLIGQEQFKRANLALSYLGWGYTDIKLPENKTGLPLRESVWQFDNQKFGYLCFLDLAEIGLQPLAGDLNKFLDERTDAVTTFLNQLNQEQQFPVLVLMVTAETGQDGLFMWRKMTEPNLSLGLRFHELLTIAFERSSNALTLWKFARVYHELADRVKIMAMGGTLDVYAVYAGNKGSLLDSEKRRPAGVMHFPMGISNALIREVQQFRDEHAVRVFVDGIVGYAKVIRKRVYAPIYELKEKHPGYRLMIECYKMPVWVGNHQQTNGDSWAKDMCEAVAYWLYKIRADLAGKLESLSLVQFDLQIEVDERLLKGGDFVVQAIDTDSVAIEVEVVAPKIILRVPYDFLYVAGRSDNLADQMLVKAALKGIVNYTEAAGRPISLAGAEIEAIISHHLQPPQAKMILFGDSAANVWLDNRKLPPARYIQDTDTSRVLENLVNYLSAGTQIPADIRSKDGKIALCDDIVHALAAKLSEKISAFEGKGLLAWLVKWNERCIFTREFREILIPAKIACFSEFDREVQELLQKDADLVPTSLSLRTLIEFVASAIPHGTKWPNYDDVDELLALTEQMINWGGLSEAIRMGIDDPRMGLLPSGRIGSDKTFQRARMEPYMEARMTGEVYKYVEQFEQNYVPVYHREDAPTVESDTLDEAFFAEFGITLTHLCAVSGLLVNEGFTRNKNSLVLTETEIGEILATSKFNLDAPTINAALKLMTLLERSALLIPPDSYTSKDIFPWRYTRPLSYLRRPLIAMRNAAGENCFIFGYRHVMAFIENLLYLLHTGKFPEKQSEKMQAWIGRTLKAKGTPFRDSVRDWFKANTPFEVIDYEVKMDKNGHITTDKAYGDIDVFVIDHEKRIVYSIECKNNVGAKNIHEMKVEMDLYLGREGQEKKAKIRKHMERHHWLTGNPGSLKNYLENPEKYKVKSLIMTAEEMPLGYLAAEKVLLPIISFNTLRAKGIACLP
jgi:hypothetical protein